MAVRDVVEEGPEERLDTENKGIIVGASRKSTARHACNAFCGYATIFKPKIHLACSSRG